MVPVPEIRAWKLEPRDTENAVFAINDGCSEFWERFGDQVTIVSIEVAG